MPIFAIPTSDAPFYRQKTALDGVNFTLSFAYNQREDRWYLSIADDEETPIVSGIKLIANSPLLYRHRYNLAMPAGEMMALDTTSDGSPPGLGELGKGKRVRLIYFDRAWIAASQPVPQMVPVQVFLAFTLSAGMGYVGDAAFAAAVAGAFNSVAGQPVSFASIRIPAGLGATVTGFDLALSPPSPAPGSISASVLTFGPTQTASLSASQISVVSSW